jgi:hypothetical protein
MSGMFGSPGLASVLASTCPSASIHRPALGNDQAGQFAERQTISEPLGPDEDTELAHDCARAIP